MNSVPHPRDKKSIILFGVMPCGVMLLGVTPYLKTHNPFEFGRELSREELIDRTD